ncbi:hypothetical protein CYMTET_38591 [Cymbomonas tetramitiformis]|uniref:Class I SAM-dependent methyltransferase n=1 Tax=Cymbomonas tetramitiformis TaxID=36881 RepID=A0AAE0F542_9CHLO|nr:hypothetical protein CYMTET_38591 [Cymbomonas tetramitiformis]|eukprot:gene6462-7747_t
MRSRGQVPALLNEEGFKVGVELGVDSGMFSKFILMHWKTCEKHYMVDLWAPLDDTYKDGTNNVQTKEHHDLRYETAQKNVEEFPGKYKILRNSTVEAVKYFEDESVDFIYIDARHDYMSVKEDLELWYPKIRPGGIIAGHDYLTADEVAGWEGPCPHITKYSSASDYAMQPDGTRDNRAVKGAVDEFAAGKNRQVQVTYADGSLAYFWYSYFFRK